MKFLALLLIIISSILLAYIFVFKGYKSAFEADQACHSLIEKNKINYLQYIDCDHDTETRQWILYESGTKNEAAKVIRRFKY